jgi:hypothetical protein
VRGAAGTAGLQPARRRQDHPGGVARAAHLLRRRLPGRHAGQPGRPRWLRAGAGGARAVRARQRRRHLRLDRLRPARGRRQLPVAQLHPRLLRLRPPLLRAGDPGAGADLAGPLGVLRRRLRAQRGGTAAPHEDHRQRQGHGEHPQDPRRQADQLLRLLLRHLPGAGLLDPVPVAGAAHGAGQQRRPAERLVPGQPQPGRGLRPRHQHLVRLGGQVPRGLPPGRHQGRGAPAVVRPGAAPAAAPGGRPDRRRRVDRRVRAGRLQPVLLARPRRGVRRLGAPGRRPGTQGRLRRCGRPRRRQRLRRLPRRAVHRRPVADELEPVAPGQLAALRQVSVPDLGQRLVQRAVHVLARAGRQAGWGQRPSRPRHPADRRDPRRRDAVRGQPRGAAALPQRQPDRRAGRHLARQLAVRQRLRRRPDRGLPRRRHAAGAPAGQPAGRDLRAAAAAGTERPDASAVAANSGVATRLRQTLAHR